MFYNLKTHTGKGQFWGWLSCQVVGVLVLYFFFFFARQLFLSQGPTIPSWNRLLWANLPSPHPPSKAASDSDSNNSQHEDILTALFSSTEAGRRPLPAPQHSNLSPGVPSSTTKIISAPCGCADTSQGLQHPSHRAELPQSQQKENVQGLGKPSPGQGQITQGGRGATHSPTPVWVMP